MGVNLSFLPQGFVDERVKEVAIVRPLRCVIKHIRLYILTVSALNIFDTVGNFLVMRLPSMLY